MSALSVEELLGLRATEDPNRFNLQVHEGVVTQGGSLQGGAGLGAAVTAMAATTGRPLVWATGHFLRHAARDACLDLAVAIGVKGHKVTQAAAQLVDSDHEVLSVVAAFGSRDIGFDHTFVVPPRTAAADACPLRPEPLLPGWEVRRALGRDRDELDGSLGPGRSASWFRRPKALGPITPGELAIIGDCSALEVSDAVGFAAVNHSLDNTLRMAQPADTEWVLLDANVASVTNGFASLHANLWAEDGTLLAVFSQTLVVRRADSAGRAIRTTKRYAGGAD